MSKKPDALQEFKEYTNSLTDSFQHWEEIHTNGCNDPFWPDGTNLNLVRNHIIAYKRNLERLSKENLFKLPDIYYEETPDEVPNDYMAKKDEIRKNIFVVLNTVETHPDYKYLSSLKSTVEGLDKKSLLKQVVTNIFSYIDAIKWAIEHNDYVHMRRCGKLKNELEHLSNAAEQARKIITEGEDAVKPQQYYAQESYYKQQRGKAEGVAPYDPEPEARAKELQKQMDEQKKEKAPDERPEPVMKQLSLF